MSDRDALLAGIKEKAVLHGDFVLSSGQHATTYVDLRRVLLDGRLAPLAGRLLLDATADLPYEAVGGLTLGADPVACAMMAAAGNRGTPLDAFVVRKAEKAHGLQRRIEGPDVTGRRVLAVEDTSTTGGSVLTAVDALQAAGAEVVGVAVLVERGARSAIAERGLPYRAVFELADLGLLFLRGYAATFLGDEHQSPRPPTPAASRRTSGCACEALSLRFGAPRLARSLEAALASSLRLAASVSRRVARLCAGVRSLRRAGSVSRPGCSPPRLCSLAAPRGPPS